MGNIPVIQEAVVAVESLGDVLTGNAEHAKQRWDDYLHESVLGSGVKSLIAHCEGNDEEAREYLKGMAHATGEMVLGGGLLSNVPVFQELATAGESLGDVIAGEPGKARQVWTEEYLTRSCIGSGIESIIEDAHGNHERAAELRANCGKAWESAGVTVAATAITVVTGIAVPGAGAIIASAVVGFATGVGSTYADAAIWGEKITPGDAIGSGLVSAAASGFSAFKVRGKLGVGRMYRVIRKDTGEGESALRTQKFQHGYRQGRNTGETWFSESTRHSRPYMKQMRRNNPDHRFRCYQAHMKKSLIQKIKREAIDQRGSKKINRPGQSPRNVYNFEKLKRPTQPDARPGEVYELQNRGKVNLGIKTPNLEEFNESVMKIKKVNPYALKHTIPLLKPVARYGTAMVILSTSHTPSTSPYAYPSSRRSNRGVGLL